jgi:hypothetical protein
MSIPNSAITHKSTSYDIFYCCDKDLGYLHTYLITNVLRYWKQQTETFLAGVNELPYILHYKKINIRKALV